MQISQTTRMVRPADVKLPDYQREQIKSSVKKIASDLQPAAFGIPVVWENGNGLYCVDGQQRIAAAVVVEVEMIEVQIITGSAQDAAKAFSLINAGRKNLTNYEKFVGAVAAEEPDALEVRAMLDEFGLGKVPAMYAIQQSHQRGQLRRVLETVQAAWGFGVEGSLHSTFVDGLTRYLHAHPRVDPAVLGQALREESPYAMIKWASAKGSGTGAPGRAWITKRIGTLYSRRRRAGN